MFARRGGGVRAGGRGGGGRGIQALGPLPPLRWLDPCNARLQNLVGFQRVYGCAQHVTLGESFLSGGCTFRANFDKVPWVFCVAGTGTVVPWYRGTWYRGTVAVGVGEWAPPRL